MPLVNDIDFVLIYQKIHYLAKEKFRNIKLLVAYVKDKFFLSLFRHYLKGFIEGTIR